MLRMWRRKQNRVLGRTWREEKSWTRCAYKGDLRISH